MATKRKKKAGRPYTFGEPGVRTYAYIPAGTLEVLSAEAVAEGRSLSNYIARILTEHINKVENQ